MSADGTTPLTIAICVPSKDEWKADTAYSIACLAMYSLGRVPASIAMFNFKGSIISKSRNETVKHCLAKGYDYLLWIDSDMVVPPAALQGLFARGKDIVGATYTRRLPPFETLGRAEAPDFDPAKGGLAKFLFLPGGMMLVKASVYRTLGYPWYFETYDWRGGTEVDKFLNMLDDSTDAPMPESLRAKLTASKDLREWLNRSREARNNLIGDMISEDNNFCRRARAAGFEIWCDVDLSFNIAHIGEQYCMLTRPLVEPGNPLEKVFEPEAAGG